MSSQDVSEASESSELQFENAEYQAPTATAACEACHRPVVGTYYTINDKLFCAGCREAVEAHANRGSGFGRFVCASLFGMAASFAGFLIYFGILKATGYEIGLISVLVGFMVGTAVRNGSRRRGGWLYQALAVFWTYTAIAASYAGHVLPEMIKTMNERAAEKAAAPADPAKGKAVTEAKPGDPAKAVAEAKADAPAKARPQPGNPPAAVPPGKLLLGLAVLSVLVIAFVYAVPIIAGLQSPIGLLIVGFALWEAGKLNRRVPIVFNGPFEIGEPAPEEPDGPLPPAGVPSHA